MKSIYDIYQKQIYEASILGDIEDTLSRGEDEIMIMEIERKLQDDNIYYFHYNKVNQKPYTIKKVRGKWVVDALGDLTILGVTDNGCVTDGSFSFGTVNGNYIISIPNYVELVTDFSELIRPAFTALALYLPLTTFYGVIKFIKY